MGQLSSRKKSSKELGHIEARACSGVKIIIAESFLQTQKRRFAGAVTGSDFVQLPFVLEGVDEPVDVRQGCLDKVQPAENDVRVRVHGAGGLQYLLNARVRAAIDKNQSVRPFNGKCELGELEGARNLGNGVHQKNTWSDFSEFIDEDEVAGVIEFAGVGMRGIGPVEIAHLGGQGRLGTEERGGNFAAAETVGAVGGDVNGDVRIDLE